MYRNKGPGFAPVDMQWDALSPLARLEDSIDGHFQPRCSLIASKDISRSDRWDVSITWTALTYQGIDRVVRERHRLNAPALYLFYTNWKNVEALTRCDDPLMFDTYFWSESREVRWMLCNKDIMVMYPCNRVPNYSITEKCVADWIRYNNDLETGLRIAESLGFTDFCSKLELVNELI